MKLKAISLFSGIGGLDYGFEAAGCETAVALELDRACVETLKLNRSWPVIDRNIEEVETEELLDAACLRVGEADILLGGPPCQPFSKSGFWVNGQAKRLEDPRAVTLREYLRVLGETRPRVFLLENVEGLGFRGKEEGLSLIQDQLAEINEAHGTSYHAHVQVLNAADFGVPQIRRRLFIVGSRDGRRFEFPSPTHVDPDSESNRKLPAYPSAWDAIGHLPEPNAHELKLTGKWAELLPSIPEGHNYLWHTERGGGEPLFGWRRRYWSFLLKLSKSRPAWTLQAQPGPATGPFHWRNRKLAISEMAKLQTFPEITFSGSYAEARKQLGNAVPSLLAEVLARSIAEQLLDRPIRGKLKLALSRSVTPCPHPEEITPVPAKYSGLAGAHSAHPGTGKGYRALNRSQPRKAASL